MPSVRIAKN